MHDGKNHDYIIPVNLVNNRKRKPIKENSFCLMQVGMPCFGKFYQPLNSIFKLLNKILGKCMIKLLVIINDIVKLGHCRIDKSNGHVTH